MFDGAVWQRGAERVPAHARRVGYVFQDARLFGHLTVEKLLRKALRGDIALIWQTIWHVAR